MKIQYLGHACFKIEAEGYAIVLDPYAAGSVPGLGNLEETADLCLCSHGHGDHHGVDGVKTGKKECPFPVEQLNSWHDDKEGTLRGANKISVIKAEGMKAVHMGDIGCMPETEQMKQLMGADVLIIPVGGHYTAAPEVICDMISTLTPKVVIPMHYRSDRSGFDVIGTCEDFLALAEKKLGMQAEYLQTDTLEEFEAGIKVLLQNKWI